MLNDAPVAVVVPSTDLERSKGFYRDKLGLTLRSDEGPLIFEAGQGTLLQVYSRPEGVKPEHTVAAFRVNDIATVVAGLASRGVVFEDYEGTVDHVFES